MKIDWRGFFAAWVMLTPTALTAQGVTCGPPAPASTSFTLTGALPIKAAGDTVVVITDTIWRFNGACSLTKPTLTALRIAPKAATLTFGAPQQFTATATWSNGTTSTPPVTWAGHCGAFSASGLFTAVNGTCGAVTVPVWATYQGKVDTAKVTEVKPVVVAPPPPPPPPPPVTGALPAHPRVWMNASRMAFVKAQMAANSVRWQRVRSAADAQVAKGAVYAARDEILLPSLCLAYLATGNASYATRAGVVLAAFAVEANNLTGDSGYGYRFYLPIVTAGLDWCYSGLTAPQRHQAATWLMNRADAIWPETNPKTFGYAVTRPTDNYYWGFMMTGPAALAAEGDDTLPGPVSGSNRPAYHQGLAQAKWTTMALPILNTTAGGWSEGTGYGTGDTWFVARFADAFLTAGRPLSTPWFAAAVRWMLQTTMPTGAFKVPLGDQARVSSGAMFSYEREAVLTLLPSVTDSILRGQVQTWLGLIGQVPTSENGSLMLTDELLQYQPNQSSSPLTGTSYLDSLGGGALIVRQNWSDPNATVLVFRSGPGESHSALDANSLRIWKGGYWITSDANIYSASGIKQTTDNFNSLTVGGVGQGQHDGGHLLASFVSDTLVTATGQAKDAYLKPGQPTVNTSSVSDYRRTVTYLPDVDAFVVVDRVTALDSTQSKVFRWHSKTAAVIAGNTFTLVNGAQRCVGTLLTPGTLGTQTFKLANDTSLVTSNAVTVTVPGNPSRTITVIQCGALMPLASTPTTVTVGSRTVTVGP